MAEGCVRDMPCAGQDVLTLIGRRVREVKVYPIKIVSKSLSTIQKSVVCDGRCPTYESCCRLDWENRLTCGRALYQLTLEPTLTAQLKVKGRGRACGSCSQATNLLRTMVGNLQEEVISVEHLCDGSTESNINDLPQIGH